MYPATIKNGNLYSSLSLFLRSHRLRFYQDRFNAAPYLYQDLLEDAHIASVFGKRKSAVTSRKWKVTEDTPISSDIDNILRFEIEKNLTRFDQITSDLLDSLLKGYSAVLIDWVRFNNYLIPLTRYSTHDIEFKSEEELTLKDWEKIEDTGSVTLYKDFYVFLRTDAKSCVPIPYGRVLIHSSNVIPKISEDPLGFGFAPILEAYKDWRNTQIISMLIYGDRFASPIPYATIDPETRLTQDDLNDIDLFLDELCQGKTARFPKGVTVNYLETKALNVGGDFYLKVFQLYANEISKLLLGETGTIDQSTSGGSRARDEVADDNRLEFAEDDADSVSAPLNLLIAWITQLNFPQFDPPTVTRIFQKSDREIAELENKKADTQKKLSDSYKTLMDLGFSVSEDRVSVDFPGWSRN